MPPADRRPGERRRAGLVAGRHHAGLHPRDRREATGSGSPVHLLAVDDPHARPRTIALADGVALAVTWADDGQSLLAVGYPGDPVGHAHLLRVAVASGDATDLGADLDRNVMPGAPAYPGGLPAEHDGRVLFCLRDRGCTHLWSVAADGGDARPVLDGAGRVVSGLSVRQGRAALALATPTSYGEIVVLDLATGAETVLTDHGAPLADVVHHPREARTFTISDGTEVRGLAGPRRGAAGAAPAAARRARRPAQRLERRGRRDPPLPPGAGRARLGGAAAQPARQRRLRRDLLRRRPWRVGRRGRRRLPRAAGPAGQPRGWPTRPGSRWRATATAGSSPAG